MPDLPLHAQTTPDSVSSDLQNLTRPCEIRNGTVQRPKSTLRAPEFRRAKLVPHTQPGRVDTTRFDTHHSV